MTQASVTPLRSRVGRRMLLLFGAAALVPLAALALLSLTQVRTLLLQQAGTRLSAAAKSYAAGVHDRLLVARDVASLAASDRSVRIPTGLAQFRWLARLDAQGRLSARADVPRDVATAVGAAYRLNGRWPRPWLATPPGAGVVIALPALDGSASVVIGELDPAFLWGDLDERKAGLVLCVVEGGGFAALHCPGGDAMDLPARLRARIPALSEDLLWSRGDAPQRARLWGQFLTNDFGVPDWYVAASLPEDDLLAAVAAFRGSFVPAAVLALLISTLLALRQVRAMLVPLAGLAAGTRVVAAGDFTARVPTGSGDEFGELGEAFNAMSARLGRQYALSAANARIDRMILERHSVERLVECALREVRVLLPGVRMWALVPDGRAAQRGRLLSCALATDGSTLPLAACPVDLPPDRRPEVEGFTAAPVEVRLPLPQWLAATGARPGQRAWVQPLTWGTMQCGWMLALPTADAIFGETERALLAELAGRLSVGIASAWSDEELYQRAHFDLLTGLPNRRLFSDRLALEIARCERDGASLAVLFVDLDRFKAVNDSQGHGAGDALLCEAAARLRAAVREEDTVSRHGGDEFTVLLSGLEDQVDALSAARHVIEALSRPFVVAGSDCFLSASVGIALYPDNGRTPETLIDRSDTAMYRAKAAGRGRAQFFEERMNVEAAERVALDRQMRQAIERSELVLHFQPQVDLVCGRIVSAEALVRWNHPERGLVPPGHFIAMAEEGGLIRPIGRWVIEETCRQVARWREAGLALERVSLNVSGKQLAEPDFLEGVDALVVRPGLAQWLEFEITETALLERGERVEEVLVALSRAGIRIALDDFGTGFSSMAYLKRLPVDVVKIDRLFVEDVDRSAAARAFVQAMIAMSHALGKKVVAEGAEREAQVAVLRELGADLVQGYVYGRPLPADEFTRLAQTFGDLPRLRAAV